MLPKHIKIAREQGFEAGMEAYMNAPISRIHPQYAEIKACRTVNTRVKRYKALFGDKVGVIQTPFNGPEQAQAEEAEPNTLASITQALAALTQAVAALNGGVTEAEVEAKPDVKRRNRVQAKGHVLSNTDVWMLLGSNPQFKRVCNDYPATPQILWRANNEGCFERVYTKKDGWVATGSAAKYQPTDMTAPASGKILARMNKAGLLRAA